MLLDEKKEAERKAKNRAYNRKWYAKHRKAKKKMNREYTKRKKIAPQVFDALIYLRHAKRAIAKKGIEKISRSDLLVLLALEALQTRGE